jgi:hypothetical protein
MFISQSSVYVIDMCFTTWGPGRSIVIGKVKNHLTYPLKTCIPSFCVDGT